MIDTDTLERPGETVMAGPNRKLPSAGARFVQGTPPACPDYADEITTEQLETIRGRTDPDGDRAKRRTMIHAPAW